MNTSRSLSYCTAVVSACTLLGTALAANFPDVPSTYLHKASVDALVELGVINGNPDGNFYPDKSVNRAELLKMLYKAKNISPDESQKKCFKDVESGSWYESFVCDAVVRGFVNGYPDATFKPGNPVNRVEALKMITLVFGIDTPEIHADNNILAQFADVSLNAWYAKYISAAYARAILPIAGQNATYFYPDWSLLRGEAAAYIYNALDKVPEQQAESSSAASEASQRSRAASSTAAEGTTATSEEATYPFTESDTFNKKLSHSYVFPMTGKETIEVVGRIAEGQAGGLSCRLYLVKDTGFSDQYFLGYEEGNSCYITATVGTGEYQLQFQPTVAGTSFTTEVSEVAGDKNDGFSEAPTLNTNEVRTSLLDARDIYDLYKFTVTQESQMTVEFSNSENVDCIVYAMSDVDIYGFAGPQCNAEYSYPKGTYYVVAKRKTTLGSKENYTVKLTK